MENLFNEHKSLIHDRARYYYKQFGTAAKMSYEDVYSHALECFWIAERTFDPSKGCKFSTHLYWSLSRMRKVLLRIAEKNVRLEEKLSALHEDFYIYDNTQARIEFYDSIKTLLSDDAQELIELVMEREDLQKARTKKSLRVKIARTLYTEKKWDKKTIESAFSEVETFLRAA